MIVISQSPFFKIADKPIFYESNLYLIYKKIMEKSKQNKDIELINKSLETAKITYEIVNKQKIEYKTKYGFIEDGCPITYKISKLKQEKIKSFEINTSSSQTIKIQCNGRQPWINNGEFAIIILPDNSYKQPKQKAEVSFENINHLNLESHYYIAQIKEDLSLQIKQILLSRNQSKICYKSIDQKLSFQNGSPIITIIDSKVNIIGIHRFIKSSQKLTSRNFEYVLYPFQQRNDPQGIQTLTISYYLTLFQQKNRNRLFKRTTENRMDQLAAICQTLNKPEEQASSSILLISQVSPSQNSQSQRVYIVSNDFNLEEETKNLHKSNKLYEISSQLSCSRPSQSEFRKRSLHSLSKQQLIRLLKNGQEIKLVTPMAKILNEGLICDFILKIHDLFKQKKYAIRQLSFQDLIINFTNSHNNHHQLQLDLNYELFEPNKCQQKIIKFLENEYDSGQFKQIFGYSHTLEKIFVENKIKQYRGATKKNKDKIVRQFIEFAKENIQLYFKSQVRDILTQIFNYFDSQSNKSQFNKFAKRLFDQYKFFPKYVNFERFQSSVKKLEENKDIKQKDFQEKIANTKQKHFSANKVGGFLQNWDQYQVTLFNEAFFKNNCAFYQYLSRCNSQFIVMSSKVNSKVNKTVIYIQKGKEITKQSELPFSYLIFLIDAIENLTQHRLLHNDFQIRNTLRFTNSYGEQIFKLIDFNEAVCFNQQLKNRAYCLMEKYLDNQILKSYKEGTHQVELKKQQFFFRHLENKDILTPLDKSLPRERLIAILMEDWQRHMYYYYLSSFIKIVNTLHQGYHIKGYQKQDKQKVENKLKQIKQRINTSKRQKFIKEFVGGPFFEELKSIRQELIKIKKDIASRSNGSISISITQ